MSAGVSLCVCLDIEVNGSLVTNSVLIDNVRQTERDTNKTLIHYRTTVDWYLEKAVNIIFTTRYHNFALLLSFNRSIAIEMQM